ncbi:hypothetical protein [Streptomyces sp. NPDC001903]|uniref:hypothetical protein n=1 Tax=Streptomyces sp. NPDC001903 TaxID=3364622 RepID=UPI00369B1B5B
MPLFVGDGGRVRCVGVGVRDISKSRPGMVLWLLLAVEIAGLLGAFSLADFTMLKPEYEYLHVVVPIAEILAAAASAQATSRHNWETAWRAAASAALALAFVIVLAAAGNGAWFVWCVLALLASCAATIFTSFCTRRAPILIVRAAVACPPLPWWRLSGRPCPQRVT